MYQSIKQNERHLGKGTIMNIQYAVLSDSKNGRADMDGEHSFTCTADALNAAFGLYQIGVKLIGIIAFDYETGLPVLHECMDRDTLTSLMGDFEIAGYRAEAAEKRYGSYEQQHSQRVSDVL